MRVIVTGANGFIGQALVRRLLALTALRSLRGLDLRFDAPGTDARLTQVAGSIADAGVLSDAFEGGVDAVYHLASVPGGLAEREPEHAAA